MAFTCRDLEWGARQGNDEIDPRHGASAQPLVVRDEQVRSRGGGAGELDGIGPLDWGICPNARIRPRRIKVEWYDRRRLRNALIVLTHHVDSSEAGRLDEDLSDLEGGRQEVVATLDPARG